MYLLDTCVVSEFSKEKPNSGVIQWLAANMESVFLSALTLGEIKKGIVRLGATRRAKMLSDWLSDLESQFCGRIKSVNVTVAEQWGEIMATAAKNGKPRPPIDALIAATAKVDNLILVTRNVDDMAFMGVKLINPFK